MLVFLGVVLAVGALAAGYLLSLAVAFETKTAVVSIMRDTVTEIPGHGENKINAAVALGGVTVDNPIAFRSEGTGGEFFEQGTVTLDSDSALKILP